MKKPDLFTYLDYRKYLKDAFEAMKARDPKASYRSVAKEAGFTSPNFLQLVIAGKRNLHSSQFPGAVRALGLNKQEADFFANLVGFEQAKDFEEKNFHYQKMLRSRKYAVTKAVEKGQFEYFDQWYHPAVRELLVHRECDGSAAWIADRIQPRITEPQAEKSIELLERLGLVKREESTGKWAQTDAVISTPAEVASLAVANYHRSVLKLASDSIETFSSSERDLRAVTLGIPKSLFPEVKRRMEEFWRDLLGMAEGQKGVEDVIQVNLQLFPMAKERTSQAGDKNA
jgi:uncharacterized protein (TIGR02147 family)